MTAAQKASSNNRNESPDRNEVIRTLRSLDTPLGVIFDKSPDQARVAAHLIETTAGVVNSMKANVDRGIVTRQQVSREEKRRDREDRIENAILWLHGLDGLRPLLEKGKGSGSLHFGYRRYVQTKRMNRPEFRILQRFPKFRYSLRCVDDRRRELHLKGTWKGEPLEQAITFRRWRRFWKVVCPECGEHQRAPDFSLHLEGPMRGFACVTCWHKANPNIRDQSMSLRGLYSFDDVDWR